MTQQIKIFYMNSAEIDLTEISEYISLDNPEAALHILDKFDQKIANLSSFPIIEVVPLDSRLQTLNYRVLVVDNYLIFYVYENRPLKSVVFSTGRENSIFYYNKNCGSNH